MPTIASPTFDARTIAKCERLPAKASFSTKLLLLTEWHIAKSHKEAAALLKAYFAAKRNAARPRPMTFAQASLPLFD